MYKKRKLMALIPLLSICSLNIYANNPALQQGEVCGNPAPLIGFVLKMENLRTGEIKTTSLAQGPVCLPARERDIIRYWAYLGETIGYFNVGDAQGQIPLGGGLNAWGVSWSPEWSIYSNKS